MPEQSRAVGIPTLSLPDVSSLDTEDVISRRWTDQLLLIPNNHHDEELPEKVIKSSPEDFLPEGMDLRPKSKQNII